MTNHIYIAASLDGYIARENGELDWLMSIPNPEGLDYGFADFLGKMDALVMGRKTFEVVDSFGQWPYTIPVFIYSTTMKEVPAGYEGKAQAISGTPQEVMEKLKTKGYARLYIDGGKTIHSFLEEDLIDEFIITTVAVILGSGIPLFPHMEREMGRELELELLSSETLGLQLLKHTYRRKR